MNHLEYTVYTKLRSPNRSLYKPIISHQVSPGAMLATPEYLVGFDNRSARWCRYTGKIRLARSSKRPLIMFSQLIA